MSGLIGAAQPIGAMNVANDNRAMEPQYESPFDDYGLYADVVVGQWYGSAFWPRNDFAIGDAAQIEAATFNDLVDLCTGACSAYGFTGTARDRYGSAIPSAIVKLFLTADDTKIDTVTCDANGAFVLRSPYYPSTHYITVHLTGSPDVDGITANTLIGS